MNVEKNKNTLSHGNDTKFDPDAEFHIGLGWAVALSVSIATLATLV